MNIPKCRKLKANERLKVISGFEHEINITGNRDFRSPDIDIFTKVNDKDEIEVMIPKTDRCYRYSHIIDECGFIKLIFK